MNHTPLHDLGGSHSHGHRHGDAPAPTLHLSRHAATRTAQRAIPELIVQALVATGVRDHDHCGGIRIHLHQRQARQRFTDRVGRRVAERFSDCYCIVDSLTASEVITVGWLSTRRTRDATPARRAARRSRW